MGREDFDYSEFWRNERMYNKMIHSFYNILVDVT